MPGNIFFPTLGDGQAANHCKITQFRLVINIVRMKSLLQTYKASENL